MEELQEFDGADINRGLDGDLGADYAGPHADEELSSSSFEDESEDSEDGHFEEEKQFLLHRHVNVSRVKDLHREFQAAKDVRRFATSDSSVFDMNVPNTKPRGVVRHLLDKLEDSGQITRSERNKAMKHALTKENDSRLLSTVSHVKRDEEIAVGRSRLVANETSPFAIVVIEVPGLRSRHVAYGRLESASNMGIGRENIEQLFVVITPMPQDVIGTKSAKETASTFASLLANEDLFLALRDAKDESEARDAIIKFLDGDKGFVSEKETHGHMQCSRKPFGGFIGDISRRLPWYVSDWVDGVNGWKTLRKVFTTVWFLYFACILPAIAFGVLNHSNTDGAIDVKKTIYAQAIGGIIFSFIGGQPMIVLLSTAPLALYIKVIYTVSQQSGMDFYAMFAWVGIFNSLFLVLYAVTEASVLMKYVTRWVEETFGFFISIAFTYDAIRPLVEEFIHYFYFCGSCHHREYALFYFALMLLTTLVGYYFFEFRHSPYFVGSVRDFVSDFSLPLAVAVGTFFGSVVFLPGAAPPFVYEDKSAFNIAGLFSLPVWAIAASCGMGFLLSLLFFMDQNISASLVNAKENKLRKGTSYHLDLYVVAIITVLLSMLGLPWVHAALPHSPLHVRAMADAEHVYHDGRVESRIVYVREQRVTTLFSHLLILVSVLMVPIPLQWIPVPVLYGVFLYLAITALPGNQFWERIKLFITQRIFYPTTTYVRKVPARIIHAYTVVQIFGLLMLCVFGFVPVDLVQLFLPLFIILLVPIRVFIVGRLFRKEYLQALDAA